MSCSLKRTKDTLQKLGITSKFLEVKSMDMMIRYENANHDALTKKHGDLTDLGNMFFFENLGDKTKVKFNKEYFLALDQLENAVVFKNDVINEFDFNSEDLSSEEEFNRLQEVYSQIDEMLASNEITVTCKI